MGQQFGQRWQVALTTFKGLLTTFGRLLAIFQGQLALCWVRVRVRLSSGLALCAATSW